MLKFRYLLSYDSISVRIYRKCFPFKTILHKCFPETPSNIALLVLLIVSKLEAQGKSTGYSNPIIYNKCKMLQRSIQWQCYRFKSSRETISSLKIALWGALTFYIVLKIGNTNLGTRKQKLHETECKQENFKKRFLAVIIMEMNVEMLILYF